jgi:hypothetical protein
MTAVRSLHTATLLNNGKVLIAGGNYPYPQTAELYDPATRTFSPTGDMTETGADTATLLANGKVLFTRSTQLFVENHADIYDPVTGTFTRTGDILDADPAQLPNRSLGQNPSAILLTNGTVLLAGGAQGDFWATGAQLYDASTASFRITGELTAGIGYWQAAALLPEGKVLIAGESPGVPCDGSLISVLQSMLPVPEPPNCMIPWRAPSAPRSSRCRRRGIQPLSSRMERSC